ncbi:type IX secretion system membrane protein PorP/SprF [Dysgonomonas sp. Marseille-P4361]|uniref:PorP/SprF family type IX secretion system membrane protein n=1 Tax=Dysgonomonas sp. Marseille-P4361 TaxID=2161820 RepID=UPI000D55B547|nr:type IX secretion system membrane protein PorP/SprF [Dysgonomonas sp. Marseille-P4361]
MRFKYTLLIFLFLIVGFGTAYGQWDAQISQYWKMKNFYNPSFIAETSHVESSLIHRRQWVGITNAPVTSVVSMNMPISFLGKDHGIGAIMTTEKAGLFTNTSILGQYTYKIKFKNNKRLHIGLQGGMLDVGFDAGGIFIPESSEHDKQDIAIPGAAGDKVADAGLGVAWITPAYYVGLSVNHLWEPKFALDDSRDAYIARTYFLMGGYNIKLSNPLIELQPSAFFKTDAVTYQVDLTAKVEYNKMFTGGVSWRKDEGFVFLLGVKIRSIDAGYSYDLSTSELSKVSHGSHEVFIRYSFPLEKRKVRKVSKSIRIL